MGRPDRGRIAKDTEARWVSARSWHQAKREKLLALREREQASLKKSLEKAIARSGSRVEIGASRACGP